MSLLNKLLILLLVVIIAIMGTLFAARHGVFNHNIAHLLEYYLSSNGNKAEVSDLSVEGDKVSIRLITVNFKDGTNLRVQNLTAILGFSKIIKSLQLTNDINAESINIENALQQQLLKGKASLKNVISLTEAKSETSIILDNLKIPLEKKEETGNLSCLHQKPFFGNHGINCNLNIGDTKLFVDTEIGYSLSKLDKIKLNGEFYNLPITIYQIFLKLAPGNKDLEIVNEYVKAGLIESGKVALDLDKEFFKNKIISEKNIVGNFVAKDFELSYDKDYPRLKNMDIEANLTGGNFAFLVKKAFSNNSLLSNGVVSFNWQDAKPQIIINVLASGPATDLIDFIPATDLKSLTQKKINLKKLTGTHQTRVERVIPLSSEIKNTYNITSEIKNVGLKIFNDAIEFKKGEISGIFDGNQVALKGRGVINEFNSDFSYRYDFEKTDGIDQLLNIKLAVQALGQKINLIRLNSGKAQIDFEYKNQNDIGKISINSDLKNLDFYIDKISIHKEKGAKAALNINGEIGKESKDDYKVKLSGDNGLMVNGTVTSKARETTFDFPTVMHQATNIKISANVNDNEFSAKLEGSNLDLSKADMMQYLKKEQSLSNGTNLKLDIGKVILNNGIALDDVKMKVKCDKEKCYKGHLDSKLGSKFLKMLLKTFNNKEEWVITSNNAGAVFKGIGLYNNMKTGSMILVLNTSRKELKPGEIVPILDGSFTFKKFAVVDTPVLTRMVSFISLPGFVNFMRNNKDVVFKEMTGNFDYNNDMVKFYNAYAEGPFFDFTMKGEVDTKKRKVKLKGNVVPSLYGINTMMKYVPLVGNLLSKGRRKGIVTAPYTIEQNY
jgi:hypothetical protein